MERPVDRDKSIVINFISPQNHYRQSMKNFRLGKQSKIKEKQKKTKERQKKTKERQ